MPSIPPDKIALVNKVLENSFQPKAGKELKSDEVSQEVGGNFARFNDINFDSSRDASRPSISEFGKEIKTYHDKHREAIESTLDGARAFEQFIAARLNNFAGQFSPMLRQFANADGIIAAASMLFTPVALSMPESEQLMISTEQPKGTTFSKQEDAEKSLTGLNMTQTVPILFMRGNSTSVTIRVQVKATITADEDGKLIFQFASLDYEMPEDLEESTKNCVEEFFSFENLDAPLKIYKQNIQKRTTQTDQSYSARLIAKLSAVSPNPQLSAVSPNPQLSAVSPNPQLSTVSPNPEGLEKRSIGLIGRMNNFLSKLTLLLERLKNTFGKQSKQAGTPEEQAEPNKEIMKISQSSVAPVDAKALSINDVNLGKLPRVSQGHYPQSVLQKQDPKAEEHPPLP